MIKPGDEPILGYRVEVLLGRGQFGEVWRARSPGNASVALKFLEMTGTHGWKEFRAIQRVKQIRHVHLMPIVAIWLLDEHGQVLGDDAIESIASSHEEQPFGLAGDTLVIPPVPAATASRRPVQLIVATLLADQSLADRMKQCHDEGRPGIPIDELLGFMDEAARGLDFLNSSQHKVGDALGAVQHCDVKPANILLTGGSVVISDFGVAQTLTLARLDATATSLGGTPAYMAPELFSNRPNKTSDQYSLAVTYYELRTGRLPFIEQTYAAVYHAHRDGTLDFSACKPAEQLVLRRATATNPEHRFSSCAEFVEHLDRAVRPAEGATPAAKRSFVGVAAALFAGLIVATTVGYGAFRWFDREDRPQAAPLARVTILVDPADATVTIDGQPARAAAGGQIIAERPLKETLTVKASKPPDRLDAEVEIELQQAEQRRELTLPFSAVHFATEAERLTTDGPVNPDAVKALAAAIKLDPATYARLPDPLVAVAGSTPIESMQLSGSGRRLAIASRDGAVRRWSIDAGKVAGAGEIVHQHHGDVQGLSTTDDWTASFSDSDGAILLTPTNGPTITLSIPEASGAIKHLAIAGDGRTLVAMSELLDLVPPVRRSWALHAWTLDGANVKESYRALDQHEGESEPVLAAAHHKPWVVVASTDGEQWFVRRCPVDSVEQVSPLLTQSGDIRAIVVSADDRLIAVGGGAVSKEADLDDYKATLIDVQTGRSQILPRAHRDSISVLAFDAAGKLFAAGDVDGNAQAWTIPADWDGSRQPSEEPIFLPDGSDFMSAIACPRPTWVACSIHGRVILWDCQPGDPQAFELATAAGDVTALAATPDGRWIVTGHEDGSLRFWLLPRIILVHRACTEAGVPLRANAPAENQARRYGRPFPPGPYSPAEMREIASRPWRRPNATPAG